MSASRRPAPPDLEQVYRDHELRLRQVAGRGGRQDAADLVHDAVVKTLEAGRRTEILEPVRFLFHVTRNTLLDSLRSRTRRERVLEYGLEETAADPSPAAEHRLLASENLKRALAVIDDMPPRRREAFLLCRMEELTYAQAARRMGVTVHAIEKHMTAAMAQLSKALGSD